MNRTQKFFYNSVSTAFMQLITMLAGFIVPRVMLKSYGSEINGLVSSISQFIAYFNLVEAGLSGAAIYALYKPLADNDFKMINAVVSAAKRFYTMSGYIFVSLTLGLAVIYPIFVRTNALSPYLVGMIILILGVSGALEFFTLSKYRVILTAHQKNYVISLASTITILANTIIIVALAHLNVNIVLLRAIALTSVFIRQIILSIYIKIKYKFLDFKVKGNNEALDKRWDAFYMQILGSIQVGTPVILATIFTNLNTVSIYSIFNMIITGITGVLGIFNSGLPATFGELLAREEITTLQKAYREFEYLYYCLLAIIYSVTFITIMPFIRLYTRGITDVNYDLPILGVLFIINSLLSSIKNPQGMLVVSAGMYRETRWQTTIQGAIVIVLGIILAPFWGLVGIMISSIASNLYRDIDLIFFVPRNISKLKIRQTLRRIYQMTISLAIIICPFLFFKQEIENYLMCFLLALVAGIFSLVVVLIMGMIFDKKEIKNIFKRITMMLGVKRCKTNSDSYKI
jgi:O-antigen/teichoic acid export membrane protein